MFGRLRVISTKPPHQLLSQHCGNRFQVMGYGRQLHQANPQRIVIHHKTDIVRDGKTQTPNCLPDLFTGVGNGEKGCGPKTGNNFAQLIYAEMFKNDNLVAFPEIGYFAEVAEFRETFADAELQRCMQGLQTPEETLNKWAEFLTQYRQVYMVENPDVEVPMPKYSSVLAQ